MLPWTNEETFSIQNAVWTFFEQLNFVILRAGGGGGGGKLEKSLNCCYVHHKVRSIPTTLKQFLKIEV